MPPPLPEHADPDGFPVVSDPENFRAREPLEVLVTRFADAVRRGERPSIDDYVRRYSQWQDQIRELFPLIESLEHWKADKEVECLRRGVLQEFRVTRLGTCRIVRELGRGGMGIVFEAIDDKSQQRVAVKLLPWRFAADMPQWEERIRREATTIARLRHANIVEVYSYGRHEGYCYYVMQLVKGVSLDWIIRRLHETSDIVYVDEIRRAGRDDAGDLPPPAGDQHRGAGGLRRDSWYDFANIALQVALALTHAHEAGVLHNDIKPANILVERHGHVVVTDFGIGRRVEEESGRVEEHPIGTLRYMSPERLSGHLDAQSDVYALGLTLYELVTQTPAFASEDKSQLVNLILTTAPAGVRQVVPQIPRGLALIIENAIAPDARDRYASAAALATDLLRFVNGLPVASRRPSLLRRLLRRLSAHSACGRS